jgi:hypothetical protein
MERVTGVDIHPTKYFIFLFIPIGRGRAIEGGGMIPQHKEIDINIRGKEWSTFWFSPE